MSTGAGIGITGCSNQRGFALVIGLIMLLLLTLSAVAAFHLGADQTIVVANAQHQNEGVDAARQTIDTVINSGNFATNPAAAIPQSNCSGGGSNSLCIDVDGDGTSDFTVTLAPQPICIAANPIMNNALQISSANSPDEGCLSNMSGNPGVTNSGVNGASACTAATWEISAQAVDSATSTTVNAVQGVGVRIPTADVSTLCP